MEPPEGKKFYGLIKVSERGQIVIPAEARRDFSIDTGDKLLVFGDMEKGLWIATFDIMGKMEDAWGLLRAAGISMKQKNRNTSETNN